MNDETRSSKSLRHWLLIRHPSFGFRHLLPCLLATALHAEPPPPAEGSAIIQHQSEVLKDRGQGGKHLWPLLSTPEARMNYFEVTSRGALHYHPDADHRLYVLEGAVLVTCGKETTLCHVGDFIIIPKGVPHCYDVADKGGKALLLTFDAPPYDHKKTVNLEAK
ncbi:MAG: cupin domain protein [Verrucomicrobiaceae bacterium]|nr:cupin domain protein [Verrucomicrobiaceae bacterium]